MFTFFRNLIHALRNPPDPNWHIEKRAQATHTHPFGGFWKRKQNHNHGLAIGPSGDEYYISFCGPGGCFAQGTYRPNSKIVDDPDYRVVDENTIEIKTRKGFVKYMRVKSR